MDVTPGVLSGTFAGRYVIERELGHGATATVYLARDTQRARAVAIKVLRTELAQSVGAERFLREVQLTEQLHHVHIVPVFESGEYEGQLYCVLPHMEGGSLRQRLEREKQLSIDEAVSITQAVARALDYAHKRGLIHRDVKPENILFTSGQACLADFGIARAIERTIDESTTSTGLVRGTPAYMSPEQASGSKDYDGRTDIYSLACVLYEMIAGVPAFIGPTAESIIAQRFAHAPRDIRVYRQTVPQELGAVLQRALELLPVDRYMTAGDFADALGRARLAPRAEPRTSGPTVGKDRSKRFAFLGAALFVAAVGVVGVLLGKSFPWSGGAQPDTTTVAVLPPQGDVPPGMDMSFRSAFARWGGINVPGPIDVSDAIRETEADMTSDREVASVASTLRAGRYVRARVQGVGGDLHLDAGLYDVATNRELEHATTRIPAAEATRDSSYFALADSLLLREAQRAIGSGTRSLPAAQTFARALHAIDDWDLQRADSLLQVTRSFDPGFALATLRLAQVRFWRGENPERWLSLTQIAASQPSTLPPNERRAVAALSALGREQYAEACRIYEELRRVDDRSFAVWYGLGRCRADDDAVLRDGPSPSGWRFRSSAHRAVLAYARAFELLPSVHRGFSQGAYEPLRRLLYTTSNGIREGNAMPPDTGRFYARPMWLGDSLAFIPYRAADFGRRVSRSDVGAILRAQERQQALFRRIALSWSAALPQSAGAKEAVAVALEMTGDPSALDTLRLARRLTTDEAHELGLAVSEAVLLVKFGLPSDSDRLVAARHLADSLLGDGADVRLANAGQLARAAALTGRCDLAAVLAGREAPPSVIPNHIGRSVRELTVGIVLGCRQADGPAFRRIADAITANVTDPLRREAYIHSSLLQPARLADSPDTAWINRLAEGRGGTLLAARRDLLRGDSAAARATLESVRRSRGGRRAIDVTPDALLAEARIAIALGDTAAVVETLASALNNSRFLPEEALADAVGVASFIRLVELYATVAPADTRQAWSKAFETLTGTIP